MERAGQVPAKERLQRLIDKGFLDEQGNVRDKVRCWHAFPALIAVKPGSNGRRSEALPLSETSFRLARRATIDVSRESLAQDLAENKRTITAYRNEQHNDWKEGAEIHVTYAGYLHTDANEDERTTWRLPEFTTDRCGLCRFKTPVPSLAPVAANTGQLWEAKSTEA